MSKGRLIVVEGLDGVGKSTMIRELSQSLPDATVITLPRSTDKEAYVLGQQAYAHRESPLYGLMLMTSKLISISKIIKPLIESGHDVICDRWLNSTMVYGCIRNMTLFEPMATFVKDFDDYVQPDKVIYLNATKEQRISRMSKRDTLLDPDEKHSVQEHILYNELYRKSFESLNQKEIVDIYDVTEDLTHDRDNILKLLGY